jgi:hypothetical protein
MLLALLFCVAGCTNNEPFSGLVEQNSKGGQQMENSRPLPAPGTVTVEFADNRLTVLSNAAPHRHVVEQVAQAAEFGIVLGEFESRSLTLEIVDSPLEKALPLLLPDLSYTAEYLFDKNQRHHLLSNLYVGQTAIPAQGAKSATTHLKTAETNANSRLEQRHMELPVISDNAADALHQEVQALIEHQIEFVNRTESATDQIRADSIQEIPSSGEGLHLLLDTLALDPEPKVRAAAAKRLSSARGFETMNGLIDAIYDPAHEVALEAIEALTAMGDQSVILSLESALNHQLDPAVQQALKRGIRSLEFSTRMASDGIEIE